MIKKAFLFLVNIVFILGFLIPGTNAADYIHTDEFKYRKCGTPDYYEQTIELNKKNLKKSLSSEEMIKKGYLNEDGTRKAKAVGDVEKFWVVDDGAWVQISAQLAKINEHVYVYVQTEDRLGNKVLFDSATGEGYVTQGDVNSISREFYKNTSSNNIYETTRSTFGVDPSTGIDGETRITILLLDIDSDYADYVSSNINWWTSAWIAGYFYSVDTYTESDVAPLYHSNERKIIYIDTYPTLEHGSIDYNTFSVNPVPTTNHGDDVGDDSFTEGAAAVYSTLAHEFQHMINYYHDADEDTWVNEGCSGLAEYMNGYGHPASIETFVEDTTDSLINWGGQIVDYGNTYLFVLYLYEHFGGTTAIHNLLDEQENGIKGVEKMTQAMSLSTSFNDIFRDWLMAIYFDSDSLDFKYRYNLIDISDYSTGDSRDGIDPVLGSAFGFGFVDPIAGEYLEIDYDDKKYLTFTGSSFLPIIVKMSGSEVVGIDRDVKIGEKVYLSDFGDFYSTMILIAANVSSAGEGSYSYSFDSGGGTEDTIEVKDKKFLCFIASASYAGKKENTLAKKVLDIVGKYMPSRLMPASE